MGAFKSAVITKKGQALLAKVVAGTTKFNFTAIKVSENKLSGDLASLTGIGTIKQSAQVASVIRQNSSNVKVSASFSNSGLSAGYYVRNIGLYATDPQEGEILYSISVADESTATADWMPPFNGIGVSSLMVDLVTAVSNASSVNVTVDPTASATVSQIVDLQEQIDDVKTFVGYEDDDIYGVEVDFSARKVTARLAGATNLTAGTDFDSLTPWGGRKRCIVADDGVVLAYRGETGYGENGVSTAQVTKTVDGAEKTYASGTKAQVMVEQPIFYVKAVPVKAKDATSGRGKQYTKARFYVSPTPKVGFVAPRAFYDNYGILQPKIYLSAYEGSIYDSSASAYLKSDEQVADFAVDVLSSIAGAKPASGLTQNLTRGNVRKLCNNRGAGWMSSNIFSMAVTEWLLMVEYASLDPQRKVGQGVSTFTDDGSTNMAVVTGATAGIGNGSGIPDGGTDGKCSVTYRGEENLWGNIWTWLDCVNILAKGVNEVWVTKIGTTPKDDTTEGYECLAFNATHANGYMSAVGIDEEHPELFIPTEASGNDTFADYVWQNYTYNGFLIAMLGGTWDSGSRCGFCLNLDITSSGRDRALGGRLLYVPQSKVA